MYVIEDEETGRFLSWRSLPMGSNNISSNYLYVTYTGKLGTDFFPTCRCANPILNQLEGTSKDINANLLLNIIEVDVDTLPIGERIIVNL